MQVLHMRITPAAEQRSASKSDSMDHPRTWSTHIRGKEATAIGNTVPIPARLDTMKKMIIGPNTGS